MFGSRGSNLLGLHRSVEGAVPDGPGITDIRSDVNPEAGENLRKATLEQNMKKNLAKQAEMKNKSKLEKREDLCEMLGRGC